jgi:hypothetical protein
LKFVNICRRNKELLQREFTYYKEKENIMKKFKARYVCLSIILTLSVYLLAGCGGDGGYIAPISATVTAAPVASAVGGFTQVTVSWDNVIGSTSYNIYWSTTTGVTPATGNKISTVTSPYLHTGLTTAATYYYVVTAVNSLGESTPSTQVSATTTNAPIIPGAPTGVSAVGGANQVTVAWATVADATSYNIYWSTTSGVTPATGTKISNATSPYLHTGRTASTSYYYVVSAENVAGESAPSVQVLAATSAPGALAAPTGVTAVGSSNQVTLSWAAVTGATSYNIYWSTTTGVTPATGTLIAHATSPYVQTGLTAATTYYYIVTAVNATSVSAPSAQASAATSVPGGLAAPNGVTAVGSFNQVTLSWAAVTGATSYNIYWSTTTGVTPATGTVIAHATSPYVQAGLTAATTYYYVVTAVNATSVSAPSAQASATATAPPALNTLTPSCATACHGLPPNMVTGVAGTTLNMPHTTNNKCGICHVIGGWVSGTTTFNMSGVTTHNNGTINILSGLPTASCGACHGLPPGNPHPSVAVKSYVANCGICHVVGPGNPITMGISTHNNGTTNFNP